MNLQDKGELVATVSVATDVSAADLVARVTKQREAGRMSAGEASDLLYPFLFDGTVYDRRQVFGAQHLCLARRYFSTKLIPLSSTAVQVRNR